MRLISCLIGLLALLCVAPAWAGRADQIAKAEAYCQRNNFTVCQVPIKHPDKPPAAPGQPIQLGRTLEKIVVPVTRQSMPDFLATFATDQGVVIHRTRDNYYTRLFTAPNLMWASTDEFGPRYSDGSIPNTRNFYDGPGIGKWYGYDQVKRNYVSGNYVPSTDNGLFVPVAVTPEQKRGILDFLETFHNTTNKTNNQQAFQAAFRDKSGALPPIFASCMWWLVHLHAGKTPGSPSFANDILKVSRSKAPEQEFKWAIYGADPEASCVVGVGVRDAAHFNELVTAYKSGITPQNPNGKVEILLDAWPDARGKGGMKW